MLFLIILIKIFQVIMCYDVFGFNVFDLKSGFGSVLILVTLNLVDGQTLYGECSEFCNVIRNTAELFRRIRDTGGGCGWLSISSNRNALLVMPAFNLFGLKLSFSGC